MKTKLFLKYIGDGSYIPGIPARDLSESEAKLVNLDDLIASGLYEEIKRSPAVKKPAKQEAQCQELKSLDP